MLSRIGARILVKDVAKMFDFYHGVLGYEVLWGEREGVYISFRVKDEYAFAIFKKENMKLYEGYSDLDGSKTDAVQLTIWSDDLDQTYEDLKHKIEFIGKPRNVDDWGMRCVLFRDPEGNLVEIAGDMKLEEEE
jgi:catechol 2,3-dioxygenase-like lactoylglutathione lyase family enzyme